MTLMILASILLAVTSLSLLIERDWRWNLAALALQYVGVTVLVANQWPAGMALIKLVVGWMAGAALGLTQFGQPVDPAQERSWPSSRIFRILSGGLVILVVSTFASQGLDWLPGVPPPQVWGGLVLIGVGMLQLGMTAQPFKVVIGLQTILSGFEILYAAVESSVLVAGLLAAINLGLALVGTYLLTNGSPEEETQ
jgi:hypothetical protein